MAVTRRQLLQAAGAAAGAEVLVRAAGALAVDPATARRNRLVVVFLMGGNDGLNTVVPTGDVKGAPRYSVYRKVRPDLAMAPSVPLRLDRPGDRDEKLGLHPALKAVHRLYRDGRVAIVQGCDYPEHNFSHFESADIWHSGEPERMPDSGWLGRHFDREGIGEGELRGLAIGYGLPLMLRGRTRSGVAITSVGATRFADGFGKVPDARHAAYADFGRHPGSEPIRLAVGRSARQTVDMVGRLRKAKLPRDTGKRLLNELVTARSLLQENLGVECVYVQHDGYDTHNNQLTDHATLLTSLDEAIEGFFLGTAGGRALGIGPLPAALAARTLVMVVSEFGRRIGENSTGVGAGTDHGAAAPALLIGPKSASATGRRLVPGLHGDHPRMGTTAAPADNLVMTTDIRRLYASVLESWFEDEEPLYRRHRPLPGVFA